MKRKINLSILIVSMLLLFAGCTKSDSFIITNPGSTDLTDVLVVVKRTELSKYLGGEITTFVVAKDQTGNVLPTQCDDMDDDKNWDELAFLCNPKAGETIQIQFEAVESLPEFPARTNIRFGRMNKPFEEIAAEPRMKTNDTRFTAPVYQMEGPAWENDLIGFRNYYDARNGIDIFGKTIADMVLDSVGVNGRIYHNLADWGMDILKVGNSLGAGAIAIGTGDSLYRVGPCDEGTYRMITEGPVRAVLEFTYKGVPAGERQYDVIHRITLAAGDRFYRSQVWVDKLQSDEELVTGIVNLHHVAADSLTEGDFKVLYSLGNQGFSDEILGMGVLVPAVQFKGSSEADTTGSGIVHTHLVSLALSSDNPSEYCFLAAWENRDPQIKDKAFFVDLLKTAAAKLACIKD